MTDDPRGAVPTPEQVRLNEAVIYALKSGCFFPVPKPRGFDVQDWIKWGAMRNLHAAIADYLHPERRR